MQKTILVTGGAGYIGSACVRALVADGHKVIVFDNLTTGKSDKVDPSAELVVGDITDLPALQALCELHTFTAVMHFAAKKSVSESQIDPVLYFRNNVLGTLNILTCMEQYHIPQIVFSSTAAVYADKGSIGGCVTEDSPVDPSSVYGQSKLMSETLIKEFYNTKKISQYEILRYFNVAGDSGLGFREDAAQNVFPLIARALESDGVFTIFGTDYNTKDGTGVRDYIHLTDLVDAHLKALESTTTGIFNLGTKTGYTVRELVTTFEGKANKTVRVEEAERRAGDIASIVADATKANTVLGWKPTHTLEEMVESTVSVYGL